MLILRPILENLKAESFCHEFIHSNRPKYVFGRNEWAKSIAQNVEIDGFIDDFTQEKQYLHKPIVAIDNISQDALAVVIVIGKPLTAEKRVKQFQFQSLDYFSFFKYSSLSLKKVMFWGGMIKDLRNNFTKYSKIYDLLQDNISKNQVDCLDDLIDRKITFLKMDIEGAERSAIEGAKHLIKTYHPKLAISVYYRKDDFWKIPELILSIRSDYRIYLRHYTEGISETVMFFIPTNRSGEMQ